VLDGALASLWDLQARQWSRIKPPLRPAPEDVRTAQAVVDRWCATHDRPPRAVVLGSTIELASLRWPDRSIILALDRSLGMLNGVWSRASAAPAVAGGWLEMPIRDDSCDIIVGDGSLTQVRRADGFALFRALRRVVRHDGLVLLRILTRPSPSEAADAVWADLTAGRIGSFHVFKLRLLMALHGGDGEVRPHDVWAHVQTRAGSLERVARQAGWSIDEVATLDAYRDQAAIYWFPTLAEIRAVLDANFVEEHCCRPAYELGDRCPTLLLTPRSTSS
jgi:SAM-dependent methyltransferase